MSTNLFQTGHLNELQLQELAQRVASTLSIGDVLLLEGPVGAGKTTFARAALKSILLEDEDVPSPTFTLVQTYETTRGPLWHCDLYRISSATELEELGLAEAFEDSICLVEWPEVLGNHAPSTALTLTIAPNNDGTARSVRARGDPHVWAKVVQHAPMFV